MVICYFDAAVVLRTQTDDPSSKDTDCCSPHSLRPDNQLMGQGLIHSYERRGTRRFRQACEVTKVEPNFGSEGQLLPANRNTPSPIDPDTIQVPVGYEPDPADLALSSIPGQEMFDPRKRKFSEEELKPQPMIKKARKVFIPDDLKDDKYWARRRKNNMAAKRSRDARRLKENQIAIRASFLEKENSALRQEVADLRKELGKCKNILAKYEARHGPL